ncbi:hypothetical protein C5167_015466 [Papaver somniferum]|uniref:Aminotransferase-like plant mobile domain-containing protein n=1 Tax=Papaver somniferum TaxID=3469 RepID=A0A4Y7JA53_PAPSO|nr:hypothetical protein C5167_015466 [Papaver somniferum]
MPPLKKPNAQSKSKSIAQQKSEQRLALIAQEQEEEEQENSDNQPLVNMAYVRRLHSVPVPGYGIELNFYVYASSALLVIRNNLEFTGIVDSYYSLPEQCTGMTYLLHYYAVAKAKEANRGKTKDADIKKRRKDVLSTPHFLPPRGKDQGRNKRFGADTRGEVWDSGRDRRKLVIHEPTGTVVHDEQDEEESEEEDNELDARKGKGKFKVKGSHLPHTDDMIPDLPRVIIWGEAHDPKILFGYKDTCARTIYQTYDHKKVVRVCRNQAAANWDLSKECEEIQTIVRDSGLYALVENYVKPDSVTVNCFVERYHGETDTMHFPFGEMTLIPDDAQNILGLSVTGKSVAEGDKCPDLEWSKLHALTNKLLGWDYKTSVESFYVSKSSMTNTIKLTLLKKTFEKTKERSLKHGWDPAQIRYTAATYLLFILGTKVFPDTIGNKVSANHLQYLDPLEDIFSYSWGTVVMTHLMTEMRRASKAVTNQFVGNFTLLQVWAYEHFPTLFKDCPFLKIKHIDDPEDPRSKRYEFNNIPNPGNNGRLTNMRLAMGAMTTKDGYVIADPRRVMRQLGYKQFPKFMTTSTERYRLDFSECMTSSTKLRVEYDPILEPTHWRDREPRRLVDISNWELVNNSDEADPTYIHNYLE